MEKEMKRSSLYINISLVIIVVLLTGCAGSKDKGVLATINKEDKITLGEFNEIIAKLPARYKDIIGNNRKEFLDELIVDRLIYHEGLKKKLDRDEDVRKLIEEAKRKIIMARLLKDEVEDKTVVTNKEIDDYYVVNKGKFTTPETLRASHILVRTESEADAILVELSNGRNFEDLARARSIDPTSEIGGDIGYFARNQLVPEIEDICFKMKPGDISGVVKTRFGYHIIKLTERTAPRMKELSEVRDTIEESLERVKKKMRFNDFVTRLKEQSSITINSSLLERVSDEKGSEENL